MAHEGRNDERREPVSALIEAAKAENPSDTTRRETLEFELTEEDRPEERGPVRITGDGKSTES